MWPTDQAAAANAVERMRSTLTAAEGRPAGPRVAQELLAAAVHLHVALFESGERFPAFAEEDGVTATEVVIAASHLLEAADVEIFELQLWDAWGVR